MVHETLQEVFRRVFEDEALEIFDDTSADDIDKWDSLTHISLIVETEKAFDVRFKNSQIARLQCVGDLKALIRKHKPDIV